MPEHWFFVSEIPRTARGKVSRDNVRRLLTQDTNAHTLQSEPVRPKNAALPSRQPSSQIRFFPHCASPSKSPICHSMYAMPPIIGYFKSYFHQRACQRRTPQGSTCLSCVSRISRVGSMT